MPHIVNAEPRHLSRGASLALTGSGFSPDERALCRFGSGAAAQMSPMHATSAARAKCQVPAALQPPLNAAPGASFAVSVFASNDGDTWSTSSTTVRVRAAPPLPALERVEPPMGADGTLVRVSGARFDTLRASSSVLCRFGAATTRAIQLFDDGVACEAPPRETVWRANERARRVAAQQSVSNSAVDAALPPRLLRRGAHTTTVVDDAAPAPPAPLVGLESEASRAEPLVVDVAVSIDGGR